MLYFASFDLVTSSENFRHNRFMPRQTEHNLKSERREIKKRPRMKVSGASLKRPSAFSGLKVAKKKG
jgi:hypothetical protein